MPTTIQFTGLPTVSAAELTDIICAVQGSSQSQPGTSVQETLQQVYELMQSQVVLSGVGDPNGIVAGMTYQLYWDTLNEQLYVCTTTGTALTAVWTLVSGGGGGGGVNPSTGGYLTYYATTGAVVSGLTPLAAGALITAAGYNQIFVSGNTALTSTAYGKQIVCSGAVNHTVTLPSPVAGSYVDFQILTSSYALYTISPISGTIQGQAFIALGAGESCRLYSDGSNWWIENLVLQPVNMSYNLTNAQSVVTAANPPIQFNQLLFDANGFYNTSTYQFLPRYPGIYSITGAVNSTTSVTGHIHAMISKNGSVVYDNEVPNLQLFPSSMVTGSISMNGINDYAQILCGQSSGSNIALSTDGTTVYFTASRIGLF